MFRSNSTRMLKMTSDSLAFRENLQEPRTHSGKEKTLDNLQAQLQCETENLVRWKVTTEVALDQKEKLLGESQKTIKYLRGNLMEQQLSSEHLSQSLLREKCHREQVDAKVETTRHLCIALKQQHDELNVSVKEFEIVKDHLSMIYEKRNEEIKSLKSSFDELTISHKTIIQDLKLQASSEIEKLQVENNILDVELKLKNSLVESVQEESKTQKDRADKSEMTVTNLEKDLISVTSEKDIFLDQLNETKSNLDETSKELARKVSDFEDKILNLQINLASEKERMAKYKLEFEEAVGKIKYLKKHNDSLEGSKQELSQQLEMISQKKEKIEQEFIFTKDQLEDISCKAKQSEAKLKGQISYLEEKNNDLIGSMESAKLEKDSIISSHQKVVKNLETALQSSKETENELKSHIVANEAQIEKNQQKIMDQENYVKTLNESLTNKESFISNLEMVIKEINLKLESAKQEVFDLKSDLKLLQEQYDEEKVNTFELSSKLVSQQSEMEMKIQTSHANEHSFLMEKKSLQDTIEKLEKRNIEISEANSNSNEVLKALLEKIKILEDSVEFSTASMSSMKEESSILQESSKVHQVEMSSLREEFDKLQTKYDCQNEDFQKTRQELNLQTLNSSTLKIQLESLQEDFSAQKLILEECEKELKSSKNSVLREVKKSEKLKARIDNLEDKLKIQVELETKVEILTSENKELKELLESAKSKTTKLEELQSQINELSDAKKAAEENAKKKSDECESTRMESENKIQEIVYLMDSIKTDCDKSLISKEEDIEQMRQELNDFKKVLEENKQSEGQLRLKNNELEEREKDLVEECNLLSSKIDKLQNAIKVLTSPTKRIGGPVLKTPSPTQYLPYVRNRHSQDFYSTPKLSEDTHDSYSAPKVNQCLPASPYNELNVNLSRSPFVHPAKKTVSFTSPIVAALPSKPSTNDSDSSDALMLEVGSDMDDRFDSIRRPVIVRPGIPQANVQPLQRLLPNKAKSFATQKSHKRARYDKSILKTYNNIRGKTETELKTSSVFASPRSNDQKENGSEAERVYSRK